MRNRYSLVTTTMLSLPEATTGPRRNCILQGSGIRSCLSARALHRWKLGLVFHGMGQSRQQNQTMGSAASLPIKATGTVFQSKLCFFPLEYPVCAAQLLVCGLQHTYCYFSVPVLGSSRMRTIFCHLSSYFCAKGWGKESAALMWDLYFNLLLMEPVSHHCMMTGSFLFLLERRAGMQK